MKKIINFRFFLFLALSMMLVCILLTRFIVSENFKIVLIIIFAVAGILSLFFAVKSRSRIAALIVAIAIGGTIVSANLLCRQREINSCNYLSKREVVITARVCSQYKVSENGQLSFIADHIVVFDENAKREIDGKIRVYASAYDAKLSEVSLGAKFTAFAVMTLYEFSAENMSRLSSDYIGTANLTEIEFTGSRDIELDERIRNFVYNRLKKFNVKETGIAYAMMFGDSSYVDPDMLDSFRVSGIAHLLAVSGLHISIIISLLSFVLDKLRTNKKFKIALIAILIFLYASLCDFSVSVVRASIMSIISMVASVKGKPYDRLSSLSLAACLVLTENPVKMYSYSFILSFYTVLVIILLQKLFQIGLLKVFHNKFAGSVSLCLSVQIGISMVLIRLYNGISLLSFITNLICVPIAIFALIAMLILFALSLIVPVFSPLLVIYDRVIGFVIKLSLWIASLGGYISVQSLPIFTVITYFGMIFVISPVLLTGRKPKIIILSCMLLLIIIQTLLIL